MGLSKELSLVGDRLNILNTPTLDEARALVLAEPLGKRGLREFQIHTWELREGRMTVTPFGLSFLLSA